MTIRAGILYFEYVEPSGKQQIVYGLNALALYKLYARQHTKKHTKRKDNTKSSRDVQRARHDRRCQNARRNKR